MHQENPTAEIPVVPGVQMYAAQVRSVPPPEFRLARRVRPRQLSRELREGQTPHLRRRRWVVGLSFVGAALGKVVSLYQMGIIRRLPDLPSRYFDATRVDASDYAYKRLQTPDALLMVASYATTAILAGAGGKDRARTNPLLPIALAAKTIGDAAVALKLGREEWRENRALCGYCQAATLVSLASAALALPEAVNAVRSLRPQIPEEGRQIDDWAGRPADAPLPS